MKEFKNIDERVSYYRSKYEDSEKEIRRIFFGYTCYRKKIFQVVALYENYFLTHHCSHSEYCDRVTGVKTCKSYYFLLKYNNGNERIYIEKDAPIYFEGRINKTKWNEINKYIEEN